MKLSLSISPSFNLLHRLRESIDAIEIRSPTLARWICRMIPARCPFERTVSIGGYRLFHIPPLCKLNPLYRQFLNLRLRSLIYLEELEQE